MSDKGTVLYSVNVQALYSGQRTQSHHVVQKLHVSFFFVFFYLTVNFSKLDSPDGSSIVVKKFAQPFASISRVRFEHNHFFQIRFEKPSISGQANPSRDQSITHPQTWKYYYLHGFLQSWQRWHRNNVRKSLLFYRLPVILNNKYTFLATTSQNTAEIRSLRKSRKANINWKSSKNGWRNFWELFNIFTHMTSVPTVLLFNELNNQEIHRDLHPNNVLIDDSSRLIITDQLYIPGDVW